MSEDEQGNKTVENNLAIKVELRRILKEVRGIHKMGKPPFCSFCGKGKDQVSLMIEEGDVCICDKCVLMCYEEVMSHTKPR